MARTGRISITTSPSILALALADINLDGIPDLLLADRSNNSVSFRLGDGLGHFASAVPAVTVGTAGIPQLAKDPILVGGVGSLIRAAITVEVAKKTGAKTGG